MESMENHSPLSSEEEEAKDEKPWGRPNNNNHLDIEEWKEEDLNRQREEGKDELNDEEPENQNETETLNKWKEITDLPYFRQVIDRKAKTTFNLQKKPTPYELLETIIGHALWPHLIQQTNIYAYNALHTEEMRMFLERYPESRLHRWRDVNLSEIKRYIAMILSMALEKRGSVEGVIFF